MTVNHDVVGSSPTAGVALSQVERAFLFDCGAVTIVEPLSYDPNHTKHETQVKEGDLPLKLIGRSPSFYC